MALGPYESSNAAAETKPTERFCRTEILFQKKKIEKLEKIDLFCENQKNNLIKKVAVIIRLVKLKF